MLTPEQRKHRTQMFLVYLVVIVKIWKQVKYSSTGEWTSQLLHILKMEYDLATKSRQPTPAQDAEKTSQALEAARCPSPRKQPSCRGRRPGTGHRMRLASGCAGERVWLQRGPGGVSGVMDFSIISVVTGAYRTGHIWKKLSTRTLQRINFTA